MDRWVQHRALHVPPPRQPEPLPSARALLDALPDGAAVLDADGTIVATNHVWRMFALDNDGRPEDTGEGVNYLDVCRRAAEQGSLDAAAVLVALETVLRGESIETEFEYACPSPAVARWFVLRISRISREPKRILVTHVNITRQKAAERELERKASTDPLTGLANRTALDSRLKSALTPRANRPPAPDVGLIYLDLDGFKPVNDRFGHAAGDEVLQRVAQRLRDVVRANDLVARVGGDEFVVLAPRISPEALDELAARVREALATQLAVHGQSVDVSATLGVCLGSRGENPKRLLARADKAMYDNKPRRAAH